MVGLSIILEGHQKQSVNKNPQVINKITKIKPSISSSSPSPSSNSSCWYSSSSSPAINFLDVCFLCDQRLLPGRDIYMYKGDRAFCSVECRYRQIIMDDEESVSRERNCSFAAMKPPTTTSTSSASSSSSSSSSSRRQRKAGNKNRASGFVY